MNFDQKRQKNHENDDKIDKNQRKLVDFGENLSKNS